MDISVWVKDAFTGKAEPFTLQCGAVVRDLLAPSNKGYPVEDLYVKCNGRLVGTDESLKNGLVYSLEPRLCGGKGGFGSMLRALGAQIEKTTNREACRDLSGRRLRDVNHENAMADWLKQQAEREAEKEQRRLERLQRKLAEPKHYFTNLEYQKQCSEMSERLEDSVLKGMQASSSSCVLPEANVSRKRTTGPEMRNKSVKKKCFWTGVAGVEESCSSNEDGSDDDVSSDGGSAVSDKSKEGSAERTEQDTAEGSSSEGNETCVVPTATRTVNSAEALSTDAQPGKNKVVEESIHAAEGVREAIEESWMPEQTKDCHLAAKIMEMKQEQMGHLPCEAVPVESSTIDVQTGKQEAERDGNTKVVEERDHKEPTVPEVAYSPVDLMTFDSAAALECLGLETLKQELMALGLKCGGTLQERAARLFSVKGLTRDQIDPAVFAKPSKGKRK
ncbi:splicing regulator SDE2 isoform X2 [Ambystoma mexicanum]|uniref:splicing regulator SDE2 isoform X2 n=1 Tax=Ambystoma mexicanum TaxID=8296 RepID=UPI0037E899BE